MPKSRQNLVSLNYVSDASADTLTILDRGLNYGDGLFETFRVANGQAPLWQYHRERLLAGCKKLGIKLEITRLDAGYRHLCEEIDKSGANQGIAKILVTRGSEGSGYMPSRAHSPVIISRFNEQDFTAQTEKTGVSLQVCQLRLSEQPFLAGLKHINRLEYVCAARELGDANQGLLLNRSGELVETLHHNLFWVKAQTLFTPSLEKCGVKGVMRRLIIGEIAASVGLGVCECKAGLEALSAADEVFLSNSVRGIWPVIKLESQAWEIGFYTKKIVSATDKILEGANEG